MLTVQSNGTVMRKEPLKEETVAKPDKEKLELFRILQGKYPGPIINARV